MAHKCISCSDAYGTRHVERHDDRGGGARDRGLGALGFTTGGTRGSGDEQWDRGGRQSRPAPTNVRVRQNVHQHTASRSEGAHEAAGGCLVRFQARKKEVHKLLFVARRKSKCKWVSGRRADSQHRKVFDEAKLSKWFEYLVDNIHLEFAGRVLRQRIGIPMGTNCAVFVANLFCFTYEYAFITLLHRAGQAALIRQFRYTMRYIDVTICCLARTLFLVSTYTTTHLTLRACEGSIPDSLQSLGNRSVLSLSHFWIHASHLPRTTGSQTYMTSVNIHHSPTLTHSSIHIPRLSSLCGQSSALSLHTYVVLAEFASASGMLSLRSRIFLTEFR